MVRRTDLEGNEMKYVTFQYKIEHRFIHDKSTFDWETSYNRIRCDIIYEGKTVMSLSHGSNLFNPGGRLRVRNGTFHWMIVADEHVKSKGRYRNLIRSVGFLSSKVPDDIIEIICDYSNGIFAMGTIHIGDE